MNTTEEKTVSLGLKSADSIAVTERQYRDLMKSVAFIERETRSAFAEIDFRSEPKNGKVLYVLDSNVMRAYGAPYRHGRKGHGSFGLGQFLPRRFKPLHALSDESLRKLVVHTNQQEDRAAGNLLEALTECVKKRIDVQALGIVQLTPHAMESQLHYKTLASRVDVDRDIATREAKLIEAVAQVALKRFALSANGTGAPQIPYDQYLTIILNIYARAEELGDLNPSAVLYRFMEFCGDPSGVFDGRDVLDFNAGIPSNEIFKIARHLLSETFGNLIAKRLTPASAASDRDALVQLALLNKVNHDGRHAFGGYSTRIILITCTPEISNVAYKAHDHLRSKLGEYLSTYPGAGTGNDLTEFLRLNIRRMELFFAFNEETQQEDRWFKAFGLHYVRHISGFLGDLSLPTSIPLPDDVTSAEMKDKSRLRLESIAFFSGLFVEQTGRSELPMKVLNEIIDEPERFINVPPGFRISFIDLLQKWNDFIQASLGSANIDKSTKLNTVGSKGNDDLKEAFKTALIANTPNCSTGEVNLSTILSEVVERTRDQMVLQFSFHGTELARISGTTSRRTPPDLFFRNLNVSFKMFQKMSVNAHYPGSKDWLADYKRIAEEDCERATSDHRWENHLKFLVLAASFSCLERWSVASGHLIRALNIIDRGKRPGLAPIQVRNLNNPSGREANFLQSVCERMLADDADGLNRAQKALRASKACADADAIADSKSAPEKIADPISTLRYINEELSIALARYYLQRMSDCGGEAASLLDISASAERYASCEDEIEALKSCFKQLKADKDFDLAKLGSANFSSETSAGRQMLGLSLISASTNIVQLAVIDRYWQQAGRKGVFMTDSGVREPVGLNECLAQALRYLDAAKVGGAIEASLTHIYRRVASTMLNDNELQPDWKTMLEPISRDERDKLFELFRSGDMSKIERWKYESLFAFVIRLHEQEDISRGADA
ncbi:hypothetical protein [Synechococcus sp. CS-1328]|uniref:hypothetical protein n=1 Tax=Synechococcus sp. CS-1328 TaxID=2847976 RepID=UPI00223AA57B|nr:hypothetical protein [Synechococcus sp. CS-1328]MCT0223975.1 hypothetical protein [Synechococcus sp. CS-1328]